MRFVKDYAQVLEIGLVNKTIHAVDERVPTADLDKSTVLYRRLIERIGNVHGKAELNNTPR